MEKEKLKKCFIELKEYYFQYGLHINGYHNGKNKKIKTNAETELKYILSNFENYVRLDGEVYMLLMDPENRLSNQARTEFFEDLRSIKYFGSEMKNILNRIERIVE